MLAAGAEAKSKMEKRTAGSVRRETIAVGQQTESGKADRVGLTEMREDVPLSYDSRANHSMGALAPAESR